MAKKIMVIDDALETLALLEAVLEGQGYAVTTASSGKDALLKIRGDRPDLIILDILMPEMDGFALFKEVRKDRASATIPILVLTVRIRMEDTFRALGVEEFLAKPFDAEKLLSKIRVVFGESPAAEASGSASVEQEAVAHAGAPGQGATATLAVAPPMPSQKSSVASKRVLVATTSEDVLRSIKNVLAPYGAVLDIILRDTKAVAQVLSFRPDIIVLDVFYNDRSALDLVMKFKQIPQAADKPIILFSFTDKERIKGAAQGQRALAVDAARTACLKAGASEAMGGFEEARFAQVIKKYL